MNFTKTFDSLCSPAKLYVGLSALSILVLFLQNLQDPSSYRVGAYKVPLKHHNFVYFVLKLVYIVVWTFILNKLCRSGYKNISWFLVLLPFILFFVLIGLAVLVGMK